MSTMMSVLLATIKAFVLTEAEVAGWFFTLARVQGFRLNPDGTVREQPNGTQREMNRGDLIANLLRDADAYAELVKIGTALGVTIPTPDQNPTTGFFATGVDPLTRRDWCESIERCIEVACAGRTDIWTTRRKKDAEDPRFGPGHERLFVHVPDTFKSRQAALKAKLLAESK